MYVQAIFWCLADKVWQRPNIVDGKTSVVQQRHRKLCIQRRKHNIPKKDHPFLYVSLIRLILPKWPLFFFCFHFSARAFERYGAKSCVVAFSTTNVFCRSNPLKTKLKVLSSLTSPKFSSYDYTAASELDSSVQLQCEQLNTYRCLLWYAQGKAYSLVLRGEVCSCLTCPPTLPFFSFFLGGGRNTATNLPGANRHGLHKRGQHCVDRAVPSCERDHPPL